MSFGGLNVGLDQYTRTARLKPALLAALPAASTVASWSPTGLSGWALWGVFVADGGTLFLAQIARDRGKTKQQELFAANGGGRPSERLLSHAHAPNTVVLARRHATLVRLMPDVPIPSVADEQNEPTRTYAVYTAWVSYLISRTRDDRLLFQENLNFGFRRNLFGLKPVGLCVAVASSIVLGLKLLIDVRAHSSISPAIVAVEVFNVMAIIVWVSVFTPAWVMMSAQAYAERLMQALDRLAGTAGPTV
jgi:hypothetical protein